MIILFFLLSNIWNNVYNVCFVLLYIIILDGLYVIFWLWVNFFIIFCFNDCNLFVGVYFVCFFNIVLCVVFIICFGVLKLGFFVFNLIILWFFVFSVCVFVVIFKVEDGVKVVICFVNFICSFFYIYFLMLYCFKNFLFLNLR